MNLNDVINKTCLIGLSYFDTDKQLMKQTQLAGKVVNADQEKGISIELYNSNPDSETIASDKKARVFVLPPHLTPWFKAPEGRYRDGEGTLLIENPDYFVTWDIHQTQSEKQGDHEWWDWVPRTVPPKVN